MNTTRLPHVVNAGLLALLIGGSLWAYPALPEQIPRHFGLYGQADAYWATTLLRWMLLPIVAVVTGGIVYGSAWLIGQAPDAVNVPNQAQYDQLSPHQKRLVTASVQRAVCWMNAPLFVVFGAIQSGGYHVATTAATALPAPVIGTMAAGLLAVLGIAVGLGRWMRRRVQQLADSDGSP